MKYSTISIHHRSSVGKFLSKGKSQFGIRTKIAARFQYSVSYPLVLANINILFICVNTKAKRSRESFRTILIPSSTRFQFPLFAALRRKCFRDVKMRFIIIVNDTLWSQNWHDQLHSTQSRQPQRSLSLVKYVNEINL